MYSDKEIEELYDEGGELYKENDTDVIYWLSTPERTGEWVFTFDKKKFYNLFEDYPNNMTPEEVEIFNKENPYWVDFFSDRKK